METEHAIWTEKFRPKTFSDIKGQKDIVKRVKSFVEQKNLPHLLFAGPAGVGKTSLALVIAKQLYGDSWKQNFLELNASDERGIDVIRIKVKDFARTRAIGDAPFKIICLDECDALTREAQQALRRTMENFTQTCRFILSCNYSSKIIEPIQSRCAVFRFKPLEKADLIKIIDHISEIEKIKVEEKAKEALVEVSEGDCRKLENILQACSVMGKEVTEESVYSIAGSAKPKEVMDILNLALKNKFIDARNKLLDTMLNYGLSGLDIIKQIQKEILNLQISGRAQLELIAKCGEAEFRISEGSDEYLQLEAFLAEVALAGEKDKAG
jgi:replication factor C small subunit